MANNKDEVVELATEGVPGDTLYANEELKTGGNVLAAETAMQQEGLLVLQSGEADPKHPAWEEGLLLLGWTAICQFHLTNQIVSWGSHERIFQHADNVQITNPAGTIDLGPTPPT